MATAETPAVELASEPEAQGVVNVNPLILELADELLPWKHSGFSMDSNVHVGADDSEVRGTKANVRFFPYFSRLAGGR